MRISWILGAALVLAIAFPPPPFAPTIPVAPTLPVFADAFRTSAAAMRAAGAPYARWAAQGRHFLTFDQTGDGTATEVVGDITTATRVAVLVPGVDTSLKDFDRGLGGVARRAPAVQVRNLYDRLRTGSPGETVAVVAWLGYDTPDGIGLDAVREVSARAGAARLTGFVRGLSAQRPDAEVTLIGHSYGAIVVGLAAPHLPQVRDLVALGAPGMGASRAAALGGARVWSALAPADWIRRVPQIRLLDLGHGRRPSSAGFGARPLPTTGVAGHDYYLVPGSTTLDAIAGIVLKPPPATAPHPAPADAILAAAPTVPHAAGVISRVTARVTAEESR